jgi:hypothetical protein
MLSRTYQSLKVSFFDSSTTPDAQASWGITVSTDVICHALVVQECAHFFHLEKFAIEVNTNKIKSQNDILKCDPDKEATRFNQQWLLS